ncbi:MAG TPA: translational GTPase TypA [Bacteroidales bacterium]|nr:translational GTPase TypA [Bacteroidales bacterium]HOH23232.1 translational GTPase TypA [Bacteroidales bacterium]HPZ04213.1 translational GTPase TypA [Bacteroidales bacterium]HQB75582.1 translational GTPase TypA [Bacteroidales bacterium]
MQKIINVAIIAHVDHGKTTLVDRILYQSNQFRTAQGAQQSSLDSNDLERERGITILSKNVAVRYKDYKINIIDTPGHSDFGGEVERVLNMADGVLIVVDAFEGPMPQTRFVTQKAIELGLKPIVVINKVDKPNCNPEYAQEAVFELMFNLGATDDQLDFPTVYGSAKGGWMGETWKTPTQDVSYLLDQIITHIPQKPAKKGNLQMMISSLDYSSYVGRIAIGRLKRGTLTWGQNVSIIKRNGKVVPNKVKELYVFEGLGKEKKKDPIYPGEICAILGLEDFDIGDTVADFENPEQLDPIKIDEPTMSMLFTINTSPFFGQDGKYVTSRHLRDRLFAELEKNLAMSIQETNSPDMLNVYGRGILHLSILIETMRREGYELQVGQPQVITKEIDGVIHEPIEQLSVLVPEGFESKVIDYVSRKKGELVSLDTINDRIHLDFRIPSRGIIGLRNQILTATEGEAIISHRFLEFEPWKGEIAGRHAGALIAMETGQAYAYAIDKLQDRGNFYIDPGEMVYAGQVIGEHIRQDDLIVNVCKSKKLTNMRASGSDEKMKIAPSIKLSLEEYMETINKDEYLEITPRNLRLRKILLDEKERKRATKI